MANKATAETSSIQDIQGATAECQENIPPRAGAAAGMSKPNLQMGDVEAHSPLEPSGEGLPLSGTCNFATPAAISSSRRGKAKSRISGFQSALTPILKYMSIGMKRPVEPAKPGNNPHQTVPFFSFGHSVQPGSVNQYPNSDLGQLTKPVQWLDEEYFPEITLLDVTCDTTMELNQTPGTPTCARQLVKKPEHDVDMNWNSNVSSSLTPKIDISLALSSEKNVSPLDVTQDISSVANVKPIEPSLEVTDQILSQSSRLLTSTEELPSAIPGNMTDTLSSFDEQSNLKCSAELKACLELTRDITMGSDLENSRPSMGGQNKAIAQLQATMTHDINSSDTSGLSAKSQNATFDMQSNASLKNVTTDLNVDPVETPDSSNANRELIIEPNVTAETLDLPASNVSGSRMESETVPACNSSTETMSETTQNDRHQTTVDKTSPDVCNTIPCPDPSAVDGPPLDLSNNHGTINVVTNPKTSDTLHCTIEANPPAEEADGVAKCETQDILPLDPPAADGLSDTTGCLSLDMHSNQAPTFNLDDTLDLRADSLITSTPSAKMYEFTFEREQGKSLAAQKKLYGDAPSKPVDQTTSEIKSNLICNRKMLLTQPAVKSLLPPKAAPHLRKFKPASLLPGRFEPQTSGLPMTRQRMLPETVNAADPGAPQEATGVKSTYNLRAPTAGSKQLSSGLARPQQSGIPSGIQRVASSRKSPPGRNTPQASSTTDKTNGTMAPSNVARTSQTKKHPLTRAEALPAKKKKMDAPVSSGQTEATTTSCESTSKAKNLRQPAKCQKALPVKPQKEDATVPASTTDPPASCNAASRTRMLKLPSTSHRAVPKTQSHGCANCISLERQLNMKSEEIQRLKEELQRYREGE